MVKGKKNNQDFYSINDSLPQVAIIIAAYNEEKVIAEKLESILALNYPKNLIHVFVGNDASTDSTYQILQQYQSKFNQFYIVNNIII